MFDTFHGLMTGRHELCDCEALDFTSVSPVSHGTVALNVSNMEKIKYRNSPLVVALNYFPSYVFFISGERGGSVVECRTPEREVLGSRPTAAVLCPWARHFTPRKYWLITQEAMAPSRHDWKIVDWDVKPQHNQPNLHIKTIKQSQTSSVYLQSLPLRHHIRIRNPEAVGSNPGLGTRLEIFIYRSISPSTTFCAVTRITIVRAQGRSRVYGVNKSLGMNKIIPKHLIQMFHCSMEECGSAASEVQLYSYIGCIIDQSNWSGPFSLEVMHPIRNPEAVSSNPGRGTRLEVFIHRSISPTITARYHGSHGTMGQEYTTNDGWFSVY